MSHQPETPKTIYVRDIENRVFQTIALQALSTIEDVALMGGSFIDNLLGREGNDRIRGITVEQDASSQAVSVKLEVGVVYGVSIPDKADEIQTKITEEITRLTGIHVSNVHVVFKTVLSPEEAKVKPKKTATSPAELAEVLDEEMAGSGAR